jgi:ferredoxin-NADP reductase
MRMLALSVSETVQETELVQSFRLVSVDGTALPPFDAGAHIRVVMPDGTDRPYSLVATKDAAEASAPSCYRIGVRREDAGGGGSRHMHSLSVGDTLSASSPMNDFALRSTSRPALLIAGGIGVTPIASMATVLKHNGAPYRLHYSGRSEGALAFLGELGSAHGDNRSL